MTSTGPLPDFARNLQMDRSRGIRDQRLVRRVAKAQAALARVSAKEAGRDAEEGLKRLRSLAERAEKGEPREARLSTEAILHHHREVAKLLKPEDGAAGSDIHIHIAAPPVVAPRVVDVKKEPDANEP